MWLDVNVRDALSARVAHWSVWERLRVCDDGCGCACVQANACVSAGRHVRVYDFLPLCSTWFGVLADSA